MAYGSLRDLFPTTFGDQDSSSMDDPLPEAQQLVPCFCPECGWEGESIPGETCPYTGCDGDLIET